MKSLFVLVCLALTSVLVAAQTTGLSQGQPIVVGTGGLLSSGVYLDASQFTSGSIGSCTLGTNDNICIANAIAAIPGTPGSTGGYATINATQLGVNGAEVWTANPFVNIISNGTTNLTAPVKCGTLLLNPGHSIPENLPFWIPRCWDVIWVTSYSQGGRGIVASASFPSIITGTSTNPAGSVISTGQYQFTVTASSNFSSTPGIGQMFAVCQNNGANGPNCGGNGTTTCGTACGASAWGIILAVGQSLSVNASGTGCGGSAATLTSGVECLTLTGTLGTAFASGSPIVVTGITPSTYNCTACTVTSVSGQAVTFTNGSSSATYTSGGTAAAYLAGATNANSLIVGTNNTSHANANASNVNFVIFGDLVNLGTVSQTGSDAGGASSTITGGAYSCNDNANVAYALANFSVQEKSYWKNVQVQNCINSAMTVQSSGAVNTGPYDGMVINADSSCLNTTVPIIIRIPGSTKRFSNFTINDDEPSCADTSIDLESGTTISDFHTEDTATPPAAASITAWSITSNVVTFTATNTFVAGQQTLLSGFGTSTFFNGQIVYVLSTGLSGSQFKVNFTHANSSNTEAGTGTPQFNVASIGQNSGSVPIVTCPVMCVEPTNSAQGARVEGASITGTYTNVILIGSAFSTAATVFIDDVQGNATLTNTINDTALGCTVAGTNGDNWLQLYARNGINAVTLSTSGAATSTCPSSVGTVYHTPTAAASANLALTTMTTTPNDAQAHNYTLNWAVTLVTPGTACTGNTTLVLSATWVDPNGVSTPTALIPLPYGATSSTLALATGNNGTAGFIASGTQPIYAKQGTAIKLSGTYTAGAGCSPAGPTYSVSPLLVKNF